MLRVPSIWPWLYRGDGRLVDQGVLSKGDRFVLELGVCDLSRSGEYKFRLKYLLPKHLAFGVNVVSEVPLLQDLTFKQDVRVSTLVSLEVSNERGEQVVAQRLPLDEWVWSHRGGSVNEAFLWIRGEEVSRDLGNGWSESCLAGIAADHGWGSCFQPRFLGDYVARVNVDKPDPQARSLRATILVTGGGM